jgi:hypothetical protein
MGKTMPTVLLIISAFLITAGLAQGQDSSFMRLREMPNTGEAFPVSSSTNFHNVDINSTVRVSFIPSALALSSNDIIESESAKALQKRAEQAFLLLKSVRDNLTLYVNNVDKLRAQLVVGSTPEIEKQFRETVKAHGRLIENIMGYLESAGQREALERALSEPDVAYSKVVSLLQTAFNDLQAQVKKVLAQDSLFITVWCVQRSQGGEPVRIHMPNYDDLPSGNVNIIDKVTFSRTEDEEKYLRESLKFHESLKTLIQDIGNRTSDIRVAFDDLRNKFLDDLKDIQDLFGVGEIQDLLNGMSDDLKNATKNPTVTELIKDVNSLLSDARGFKDFINLKDLNAKLVKDLGEAGPSPLSFFNVLQGRVQQLTQFKDQLSSLATGTRLQQVSKLVDELTNKLAAEASSIPQNIQDKINDFVNLKFKSWKASFQNIELLLKKYDAISQLANQFEGLKSSEKIGNQFATEIKIPEIGNIPLTEAPETYIEIPKTNRKENDIYTLSVKVGSRRFSKSIGEQSFVLKKFGWHNTWSASLMFAKYDAEGKFLPVTGVSWLLHNTRRSGGGSEILGNVLAVGFGFNSTLFSNSGNIEFGLGVALGLFKDFLQVGYGVNLQRSSNKGYFFVGASLFDLLAQKKNE